MLSRYLNLENLLKRKSLFLFGPRMTGKTTYLKSKYPNALNIDLLDLDNLRSLNSNPKILLDWISTKKSNLIIIDEIQKMPELLNEIHKLIEEKKNLRFILTGSSARKLKKIGVNLLGGRASEIHMRPLTLCEIGRAAKDEKRISITKILNYGLMPHIYQSEEPYLDLKDYIQLYLQREIKEEALVKNFLNFSRFLDFAAHTNTELLNFTSLGSDAQIPPRTVQDYFSILEDTLIGERLVSYKEKHRKVVSTSKFYFFDIGVVNYLAQNVDLQRGSLGYAKAFEQLIYTELSAFKNYNFNRNIQLFFWRTQNQIEVDFVLTVDSKLYAIEVKSGAQIRAADLSGLNFFKQEFPQAQLIVVAGATHASVKDTIHIYPLWDFVHWLWSL